METINNNYNQNKFKEFVEEVRLLKEDNGSHDSYELKDVDLSGLTKEDMHIWLKFKDKSLNKKDFDAYRAQIEEESASDLFSRYIAEQIGSWNSWSAKE